MQDWKVNAQSSIPNVETLDVKPLKKFNPFDVCLGIKKKKHLFLFFLMFLYLAAPSLKKFSGSATVLYTW